MLSWLARVRPGWTSHVRMTRAFRRADRAVRMGICSFSAVLPIQPLDDPLFILGCGRSGTTLVGRCIGMHRSIAYLHEPREMYYKVCPDSNVWTGGDRPARLRMGADQAQPDISMKLGKMFRAWGLMCGVRTIAEKLPINSFRGEYLRALFPRARFLNVSRAGRDVARSIDKCCQRGRNGDNSWFGRDMLKWRLLVEYAHRETELGELAESCSTDYERGLMEWRSRPSRLRDSRAVSELSSIWKSNMRSFCYIRGMYWHVCGSSCRFRSTRRRRGGAAVTSGPGDGRSGPSRTESMRSEGTRS